MVPCTHYSTVDEQLGVLVVCTRPIYATPSELLQLRRYSVDRPKSIGLYGKDSKPFDASYLCANKY